MDIKKREEGTEMLLEKKSLSKRIKKWSESLAISRIVELAICQKE